MLFILQNKCEIKTKRKQKKKAILAIMTFYSMQKHAFYIEHTYEINTIKNRAFSRLFSLE